MALKSSARARILTYSLGPALYLVTAAPLQAEPRLFPVDRPRSTVEMQIKRPKFLGLLSSEERVELSHWFVALRLDPAHWESSGMEAALTPSEITPSATEIRIGTDALQKMGEGEPSTLPAAFTAHGTLRWNGRTQKVTFPVRFSRSQNSTYRVEATVTLKRSDFGVTLENTRDEMEIRLDLSTQPETQFARNN